MAAAPDEKPKPEPAEGTLAIAKAIGADVITLPLRRPPATTARVDQYERWNTGRRWGDLRGAELAAVQYQAEIGNVADWQDLCNFMLRDDLLGSLHKTRVMRVTQADYVIAPNKWGDERLAKLAAELCNELMGLIVDWPAAMKRLLHAIAAGFAAGELVWERDRVKRRYYVAGVEFVHGHRFRYDEVWQLRLYDRGMRRTPASAYGEALDPWGWIVHQDLNADYPGTAGQLQTCAWIWMFRRWVDKWHVGGVEKGGNPTLYAKVPENTPQLTRDQIQADLETIANNSAGVINDNVTIEAQQAHAATKSWEAYTTYKTETERRLTIAYLGSSDIVAPGANGSQAAVGGRISATVDPRMVDDGVALGSTVQRYLFRAFLHFNAHLLGAPFESIPVPEWRFKTADDEARVDHGDRAAEIQDQYAADGSPMPTALGADGSPAPPANHGGSPPLGPDGQPIEDVQGTALNGAQVSSLQEIVQAAADGNLPRNSALELIVIAFPTVSRAQADHMLGDIGRGFTPSSGGDFPAVDGEEGAPPQPGVMPPQLKEHADAAKQAAKGNAGNAGDDADSLEPDDPKARARATRADTSSRGTFTSTTSATKRPPSPATSTRSPSPFERALSGELVASVRSRSRR